MKRELGRRSQMLVAIFIVAEIALVFGAGSVLDFLGYKGSWVPVQHHGPYKGSTAGHYNIGLEIFVIFIAVNGLALCLYSTIVRYKKKPKLDWSQVESREDWLKRYNEERKKEKENQ